MTVATGVEFECVPVGHADESKLRYMLDNYMAEIAPYVALEYRAQPDVLGHWPYPAWDPGVPSLQPWMFRFRGMPAGFAFLEEYPTALYIREFYVIPGARRMGVGAAAVRVLQDRACEGRIGDGVFPGLLAMIYQRNLAARAFWQAQGFTRIADVQSPPWPPNLELWAWPEGAFLPNQQA